jgi:hypothetical protein
VTLHTRQTAPRETSTRGDVHTFRVAATTTELEDRDPDEVVSVALVASDYDHVRACDNAIVISADGDQFIADIQDTDVDRGRAYLELR